MLNTARELVNCTSQQNHYVLLQSQMTIQNKTLSVLEANRNVMAHAQKPNFLFRRNGRVHLNRRGASVQSTTGSQGVCISGSNAGYTMFRGSVKGTGYPLHSPVSPSLHFTSLHLELHRNNRHLELHRNNTDTWNFIVTTETLGTSSQQHRHLELHRNNTGTWNFIATTGTWNFIVTTQTLGTSTQQHRHLEVHRNNTDTWNFKHRPTQLNVEQHN